MTQRLLATKFFLPRARSKLVARPRLVEQLDAGLRKPLTLISAPAGYGKTTLLSDWRARLGSEYPLAWLSLDPDDNNLARFLTYVSAALETLDPTLPQDLAPQLRLPQLPPMEELIAALVNGASTSPEDFALVLDDCHVITDPAIHAALGYLLDHLPPKMHLVMLTRADPPIPLAKLRARGDMAELRAGDLRFTTEEATVFLNAVMGLNLSDGNVSALDQRAEGWAVGLQIAALSLQNRADADAFISAFAGSNRYILDYLSEEVIHGQSEEVRTFLLQTSILDRLCGPLCDAVLDGTHDSAQMLVELERRNLFLIPLDDERLWYRYHHLFSDLLFQRLKQTRPEVINGLYERAAAWLERNGYLENAIGYALKAQNYDLAARLMDQIRSNVLGRGDIRSMFTWLNILPQDMVRKDPELSLGFASCLTMAGYFESAEEWLRLAEENFGPLVASDPHAALRALVIPIYRSIFARFRGDFPTAIALCQDVLARAPAAEIRYIGVAHLFLGHAHFYSGDTQTAERILTDAIQENLASGHLQAYLNSCHNLAQLRVLQGRLREAGEIYERAALAVKDQSPPVSAGAEHACLGDLYREWNRLEAAAIEIEKGLQLAEAGDHVFFLEDVYLARVRLALSQRDWEAAQDYLQKAEQVVRRSPASLEIQFVRTWQARLQLAQGHLAEAGQWAGTMETEAQGLETTARLTLQQEFALLTLARIRLALGKAEQAASLLERLSAAAGAAGRHGRVLEAQLLLALADQAAGRETRAAERLARVLAQAEPEGYVRLFIDEGAAMAKLLYKLTTQTTAHLRDYVEKLTAAYLHEEAERQVYRAKGPQGDALIKPLSERELEVLRLIAAGKTNQEIAAGLCIAIGTVKRHVINIYTKLDAKNRTEAVAKAHELDLLEGPSRPSARF